MKKISGVYLITDKANGKKYVGATVHILKRWNEHLLQLKNGNHKNRLLQSAFNEHGKDSFVFSVLERCAKELLTVREQFYIDTLKPEYNLSPTAGSQLGIKRTQETRLRMSIAKRQMTQETKDKMAAAKRGKKRSPLSQETKNKISISERAFYARLKQQGEQNVS
jgi:group I intron endonuclease